jgi:zinc transport system permease protein
MMGLGGVLMDIFSPLMELIAPVMPGEVFPFFFTMELFQRALLAAIMVTIVAGFLGTFLLIRNLALIGDGLAHVSFGGVAVGIVLGATSPLWYALIFSISAAILIHEMQSREILTGDASIAIFLTGMLALGLVTLRIWGGGITSDIHGYLFGNLLLIDESDLDMISFICVVSLILLTLIRSGLLATTVDPLSARVQGLPVRGIGLLFSVITAAVVVSMVQVVGTLLVTALLVTPAATAQLVGRSFRSCLVWTQVFGLSSVLLGLYFSAEYSSGSGSMIALIAAIIFASVAIIQIIIRNFIRPKENYSNN